MFSIGVIFYELLKGNRPYNIPAGGGLKTLGGPERVDWTEFEEVREKCLLFERGCPSREPESRPTAVEGLNVVDFLLSE